MAGSPLRPGSMGWIGLNSCCNTKGTSVVGQAASSHRTLLIAREVTAVAVYFEEAGLDLGHQRRLAPHLLISHRQIHCFFYQLEVLWDLLNQMHS